MVWCKVARSLLDGEDILVCALDAVVGRFWLMLCLRAFVRVSVCAVSSFWCGREFRWATPRNSECSNSHDVDPCQPGMLHR
jgi:hypothetical protein